jgi:hypothetical protein
MHSVSHATMPVGPRETPKAWPDSFTIQKEIWRPIDAPRLSPKAKPPASLLQYKILKSSKRRRDPNRYGEREVEVACAEGREPREMAEGQQELCSAGTASEKILATGAEVTGMETETLAASSSGHAGTFESFSTGSTTGSTGVVFFAGMADTDLPGANDAGGKQESCGL